MTLLANESAVAQWLEHHNTEGCGFECHLVLRFFLCPLMVDSLKSAFIPLLYNISGISWLVEGSFIGKTRQSVQNICDAVLSLHELGRVIVMQLPVIDLTDEG